jgi:small multidrug resistance pump
MSWLYLLLAIVFEVSGTVSMKLSYGLTKLGPAMAVFFFYGLSLASLTFALKYIEVSVAYAVWSGLGTVLIATIGIMWFKEPATVFKMISIALVVLGVVGLNLSRTSH